MGWHQELACEDIGDRTRDSKSTDTERTKSHRHGTMQQLRPFAAMSARHVRWKVDFLIICVAGLQVLRSVRVSHLNDRHTENPD
jgi:hypothetical protein